MDRYPISIHVSPYNFRKQSGIAFFVNGLTRSLGDIGARCEVLTTSRGADDAPSTRIFPESRIFRKLGVSNGLKRALFGYSGNETIFHNHGLWRMHNVYPSTVSKRKSIPLIISPHGSFGSYPMSFSRWSKKLFFAAVQGRALSQAHCLHATSDMEYRDIREQGIKEQPVCVIPAGVDIPAPRPADPRRQRTVLYLSRLHPKKQPDLLLRAWQTVQERNSDWQLRIVGPLDSPYAHGLVKLAGDLNLKRTEFAGALYDDQKAAALRDADLYVLPTSHENFGIAVAEALAAGLPVITTKGTPWSGLVQHRAGWWIENNLDELISSLERSLSMPPLELQEYGNRGRAWMSEEFSWRAAAEQMLSVYSWLLGWHGKPPCVRAD
jgi:glycosyltransferase involved in cell wall biosynthesis